MYKNTYIMSELQAAGVAWLGAWHFRLHLSLHLLEQKEGSESLHGYPKFVICAWTCARSSIFAMMIITRKSEELSKSKHPAPCGTCAQYEKPCYPEY